MALRSALYLLCLHLQVITNLRIAHVEARHEGDQCLRQYMHVREMEVIPVQQSKELAVVQTKANALVTSLTPKLRPYLAPTASLAKLQSDRTVLEDAQKRWMSEASGDRFDQLQTAYGRLVALLDAMQALEQEGIQG